MYLPRIQTANRLKEYHCPNYQAILLDQITAEGSVQYQLLLAVFQRGAEAPFLIVSSEKSNPLASLELRELLGEEAEDGSMVVPPPIYFFCYFDEKGHYNLGSAHEWGKADVFEERALALVKEKLGETLLEA